MSLLDELQQEVDKRSGLTRRRKQIEGLRKKAQEAFNAQFLMNSENAEQAAFLKGKIAALDECLKLFKEDDERARKEEKRRKFDGK